MNPKYNVLLNTVVLGKAVPIALNTAFQVKARAVQLSLIRIISFLPCTSVHPGALNNKAPACAVIINISRLSILREVPVSVVYDAADTTRSVVVRTLAHSTAITQGDERVILVSDAFHSSIVVPIVTLLSVDNAPLNE